MEDKDLLDELIEKAVNDRCEKENLMQQWKINSDEKLQIKRISYRVGGIAACLGGVLATSLFWENNDATNSVQPTYDNTVIPMQRSEDESYLIDSLNTTSSNDTINYFIEINK